MKQTIKLLILLFLGLLSQETYSQVKVGDNPTTINSNSILELESTNKGLLLPRVSLSAINNASPLNAHISGMTVYNTATAGTAPNNVSPGFYYNDGTQWVQIADALNLQNIYTVDGTLKSNRIVNMENRSLDFRGTIQNFSITRGTTTNGNNAWITIRKTNNADPSVNTALVSGSAVAGILFQSANGTTYNRNASINALTAENQTTTEGGGNLVFSTTSLGNTSEQERMRILHNGDVGIGTTTPTSTLELSGSFAPIAKGITGATYTLGNKDHTIFLNDATTQTVTLPSASSCPGRIYVVANSGPVDKSFASNVLGTNGISTTIIPTLSSITIQSTGTAWRMISRTVFPIFVSPIIGANLVIASGTSPSTATDYISITIPSAGVWEIEWSLRGFNIATPGGVSGVLTSSSNGVISDTETQATYSALSLNVQGVGYGKYFVTTTGSAIYKLRIYSQAASNSGYTLSDANGKSWMSAKRIN